MSQSTTVQFIGLPPKTFIGIDLVSFDSSPHFRGITNLPPGFHFLYSGTDSSLAIRHGHWFQTPAANAAGPTIFWQWSAADESLIPLATGSELEQRTSARLSEASNRGLIDFAALEDADSKQKLRDSSSITRSPSSENEEPSSWPELTSHISATLLNRVLPADGDLSPSPPLPSWSISSISSTTTDSNPIIPGLSAAEVSSALSDYDETHLTLLPIDLSRTFPADSTGRIRTVAARDRSWYLGHLMDSLSLPPSASSTDLTAARSAAASQIIGELQFSFLMVLTLANYSCLEGWKRILSVALTCESALAEIEGFFVIVLRTLRSQVGRWEDVEGGLFELGQENGGMWLRRLLRAFRGKLEEVFGTGGIHSGGRELNEELARLESVMGERYGWDLSDSVLRRGRLVLEDGEEVEMEMDGADEEEEKGEWAPVIVDLG